MLYQKHYTHFIPTPPPSPPPNTPPPPPKKKKVELGSIVLETNVNMHQGEYATRFL